MLENCSTASDAALVWWMRRTSWIRTLYENWKIHNVYIMLKSWKINICFQAIFQPERSILRAPLVCHVHFIFRAISSNPFHMHARIHVCLEYAYFKQLLRILIVQKYVREKNESQSQILYYQKGAKKRRAHINVNYTLYVVLHRYSLHQIQLVHCAHVEHNLYSIAFHFFSFEHDLAASISFPSTLTRSLAVSSISHI